MEPRNPSRAGGLAARGVARWAGGLANRIALGAAGLGALALMLAWSGVSIPLRELWLESRATQAATAQVAETYWLVVPPILKIGGEHGTRAAALRLHTVLGFAAEGRTIEARYVGKSSAEDDWWKRLPSLAGATTLGAIEFRFPAAYLARLHSTRAGFWPLPCDEHLPLGAAEACGSDFDDFWLRIDQPLVATAILWRYAPSPAGIAVRYVPGHPAEVLPGTPPHVPLAVRLFPLALFSFFGVFGLAFFSFGASQILSRDFSPRARTAIVAGLVLLLPLWTGLFAGLGSWVARSAPLALASIFVDAVPEIASLEPLRPEPQAPPRDLVAVRWSADASAYGEVLRRLELDSGGRGFDSDDAAYRGVVDAVAARLRSATDREVEEILTAALDLLARHRRRFEEGLLRGTAAIADDTARPPALRRLARRLIAHTLTGLEPYPGDFAAAVRIEEVRRFADDADADNARHARQYLERAARIGRR